MSMAGYAGHIPGSQGGPGQAGLHPGLAANLGPFQLPGFDQAALAAARQAAGQLQVPGQADARQGMPGEAPKARKGPRSSKGRDGSLGRCNMLLCLLSSCQA